jgi:hypothetical protein
LSALEGGSDMSMTDFISAIREGLLRRVGMRFRVRRPRAQAS